MPAPRVGNCIFCDDIRHELGNKTSFMGVYTTDILFPAVAPVALRSLGIIAWLIFDVDDRPTKLALRVLIPPARTEILKIETDVDGKIPEYRDRDEYSKGSLRFTAMINGIEFAEEGFIEVMIDTERETLRVGRLRVRLNVPTEEMGGLATP
jgi:Family of unknown function (DUF6941)